jgi:hypothetical protein
MLVWAYLLKRNEKKKKESSEYIYIYSKGVKICNLKKNIIFFLNWNKQKVKVILILTKKKVFYWLKYIIEKGYGSVFFTWNLNFYLYLWATYHSVRF